MSLPAPTPVADPTAVIKNKKSRIIPPERRKKVAKACDSCKRRKQKCNGSLPCALCTQKNFECIYTGVDKRNLKTSKRLSESQQQDDGSQQDVKRSQQNQIPSEKAANGDDGNAIPPSLQPLFHFPIDVQPTEGTEDQDPENKHDITLRPEEEGLNSRLLYDKTGSLRYIGESSSGPFIQQCRRVYTKILGISRFTHDPERFVMVDSLSRQEIGGPVKLPDKPYADHLIHLFKTNVNNLHYVFNDDYFNNEIVNKSSASPSTTKPQHLCLLYLALGIGSLFSEIEMQRNISKFSREQFIPPQLFYQNALTLIHQHRNDCNLWLVEAYLLMYFYDELNMTRNAAWINLGISIRYAQALGMHRRYVNDAYKEPGYALHRRKLFRTLYIMDRTSSTHMGRSLTISDLEWDDKDSLRNVDDLQNEFLKVSYLSGKILTKVYYNPSIGIKNALKLAAEMKSYTVSSSIGRNLDFRKGTNYNNNLGLLLVHIYHLNGVIILSRPFFFFVILIKLKFIRFDEKSKNAASLTNFYQSCVKASTLLIKLLEYHFVNNIHPLKLYTAISSTLHAGLVLGMVLLLQSQEIDDDFYGDEQHNGQRESSKVVCVSAMKSAIKILNHYGEIDPTPKRYAEVLTHMLDATKVQRHTSVQESARRQQQQVQQVQPNATQSQVHLPQQTSTGGGTTYQAPPPSSYQQYNQVPFQQQQTLQQVSQPPVHIQTKYPQPQYSLPQQGIRLNYPQQNQSVDINLPDIVVPDNKGSFIPSINQRFEDWLFPKIENFQESSVRNARSQSNPHLGISPESSSSSERQHTDDLLKDLAGLNNFTTAGTSNQFLDDFLFNVVENNHKPN